MENLTAIEKNELSPIHRILLHTNGTVTQVLREWIGEIINVVRLNNSYYRDLEKYNLFYKPNKSSLLKSREIILQNFSTKKNLVYALTFIQFQNLNQVTQYKLEHTDYGIGMILEQQKLETYREILEFHRIDVHKFKFFKNIFLKANSFILHRAYNIIHEQKIWFTINEYFPAELDHFE
ncbi:MAG: chorismate--pyruvate lyase family protein [Candidatus Helarchaeota archaeon]